MKIKTNIRAGSGGSTATDTSTSTSSQNQTGKGGVNSSKPVYVPPVYVGRCVGI